MGLSGVVFVGIEEESRAFSSFFFKTQINGNLSIAVKLSIHQQYVELRIESSLLNEALPL